MNLQNLNLVGLISEFVHFIWMDLLNLDMRKSFHAYRLNC